MIGGTLKSNALAGHQDSVGEMSTIYELSSVALRITGSRRREKTELRTSSSEVQDVTRADVDTSDQARTSFITLCTRQSLQVWRRRAHFDSEQGALANRVHSSLRQEEGYAKSAERHRGFALVGTDTAHGR